MLLGRPWIHDMEEVPSTLHGILKFEFQNEIHYIPGDPKLYALCNVANFEDFTMIPSQFEIEPLDGPTLRKNTYK